MDERNTLRIVLQRNDRISRTCLALHGTTRSWCVRYIVERYFDIDTSDSDGPRIVESNKRMTVGLLAFVGLALFATSVSIIMELSLNVRQFRISCWMSWCKSSPAEGDMTSYGKHPTLQEMKNRTRNSFRCDAEIQTFRSLVTSRVRFESVFSSLLKLILLPRNLWWGLSEPDELRERSSH